MDHDDTEAAASQAADQARWEGQVHEREEQGLLTPNQILNRADKHVQDRYPLRPSLPAPTRPPRAKPRRHLQPRRRQQQHRRKRRSTRATYPSTKTPSSRRRLIFQGLVVPAVNLRPVAGLALPPPPPPPPVDEIYHEVLDFFHIFDSA